MQKFTNTNPCRWGIIGPGKIAKKFAAAIPLAGNAVLQAVASRDAARARDFAEKNGAAKWYGNYEQLVNDPDIDAIYIATPHAFHTENALLCLSHHKPVLCEKPMALNRKQVQQMVDASQQKNTFLMEAMWSRFLPAIEKILELANEGKIGTVRYVRGDFGFYNAFDPDSRLFDLHLGGGSVLDIGVYPLFLCLSVLGKPDHITATGKLAPSGADETCLAVLQYDNGATASAFSTVGAFTSLTAEIGGSEGTITIPSAWYKNNTFTLHRMGEEKQTFTFDAVVNGFEYQIREVMRCLEQGLTKSPAMSHEFSLLLSGTMDTLREKIGVVYPGVD
jgi:predicted dehydrogenase